MIKYDINEILKKKPLNQEEIEQLKQMADSGSEKDKEMLKDALIELAIHIGKEYAEQSKLEFDRLMEFVDISRIEKYSDGFTTYFQYINVMGRYARQARIKAIIKKNEEKGGIKISVACMERIQKLMKAESIDEAILWEELSKDIDVSVEECKELLEKESTLQRNKECEFVNWEDVLSNEEIKKFLKSLSEREKTIINLRFGLEDGRSRSVEEVADVMGLRNERVRQIEARTLRRIKAVYKKL